MVEEEKQKLGLLCRFIVLFSVYFQLYILVTTDIKAI